MIKKFMSADVEIVLKCIRIEKYEIIINWRKILRDFKNIKTEMKISLSSSVKQNILLKEDYKSIAIYAQIIWVRMWFQVKCKE